LDIILRGFAGGAIGDGDRTVYEANTISKTAGDPGFDADPEKG
jgi:hypothetical protein